MNIDWLNSRAALFPNRIAVIDPAINREYTYAELNQRATNLGVYLQAQNVQKGDRIILIGKNSIRHLDFLFASIKIGAIFIPLSWRFKETEIEDILKDSEPKVLAFEEAFAYSLYQNLADTHLMNVEETHYEEIAQTPADKELEDVKIEREDTVAIIYTSGSTGQPKGAMISHRALINNAFNTFTSWNVTQDDRTVTIPPMFHTAGLFGLVTPLLMIGGQIILQPTYSAHLTYDLIRQYKPTVLFMVPTMYYDMIQTPGINLEEMNSVKLFISGGAPMSNKVYAAFAEANLPLIDSYGLTEVGPNNFILDPTIAQKKRGSVGKPVLFSEVHLVDHNNEPVKDGEVGEVLIAGDHTFSGYWNNTDATREAFHGSYVRTGDLARIDEDGDYYIVGRKKEIIITGGENVYPSEVEKILNAHPLIKDGIVVGYPNERWGESVAAAVILDEQEDISNYEDKLDEYCSQHLAVFKKPKFYLKVNEFPLNSVGKINKIRLVEMILEEINKETAD